MTEVELIALVPGNHTEAPHPDLTVFSANGLTALIRPRKRRALILPPGRKQALQTAAQRQSWLESALSIGPVLAARPDTVLSREAIASMIRANRTLIDRVLERLAGQVQFQVSVTWTADGVLRRFRESPELRPHFTRGQVSAQALRDAVHRLAGRLGKEMEARLGEVSTECLSLPLTEDMLLNAAVLIPPEAEDCLDRAVTAIDAIWTEGLHIRQIGPSPAVSFALLETRRFAAADVLEASILLGLDRHAPEGKIASARRSALLRNPAESETIRQAAELLLAARQFEDGAPVHLCRILSEDHRAPERDRREVA